VITKEQVVPASGLARALDGVKSELLKLSAIATSHGLVDDSNKLGDLAVEVSRLSLSLEMRARARFVAERKGNAP
jgi:hypothetical protein